VKDIKGIILSNKKIAESLYSLKIELPNSETAEPGQFFNMKMPTSKVLLRRPFAYSESCTDNMALIYQTRGTATDDMAQRSAGTEVKIIGPLGNSFEEAAGSFERYSNIYCIAGGVGLGPILFLHNSLSEDKSTLVAGFRNDTFIPDFLLEDNSGRIKLCTDDGSAGFSGNTIECLKSMNPAQNSAVFCCGPLPMMKAAAAFAAERGIDCFVSMEEMMGCGIGACNGCAVAVKPEGFKRACKEGPVFNAQEIDWEKY
jgi:dihydroorotate dehydrogenase electron transfer subunit